MKEKEIEVFLDSLKVNGEAKGYYEGKRVMIPYGIPGETVKARILEENKDSIKAEILSIIESSPFRVTPPCRYFGVCGGCSMQHISYDYQIELKRRLLLEIFKSENVEMGDNILRLGDKVMKPFRYRNRADFSINREGLLGFKMRGTHRFFHVEQCHIMHDEINRILNIINSKKPVRKSHNILVRYGINTGDYLVYPPYEGLDIDTGQRYYHERLLGKDFIINRSSFFQVNTTQAEVLIEIIMDYITSQDRIVIDAYAGVGTFSIFIAEKAKKVIAIEESKTAYNDALINIKGFDNIQCVCEKTEKVLREEKIEGDVIILDPPRTGCQKIVLDSIALKRIRKVIYVSCNFLTLLRDIKHLTGMGYRIQRIHFLDMFPETHHMENIAILTL